MGAGVPTGPRGGTHRIRGSNIPTQYPNNFVFLAGVGCMSFYLAVFAEELLLVGSAFFGGVAFSVASVARLCASALASFAKSIVGVDHHGPRIGAVKKERDGSLEWAQLLINLEIPVLI